MSAFIEKLNAWYENLPMRQRYLVMAGIGIILAAGISLFVLPEKQPINSVVPSMAKQKSVDVLPAMPTGYTTQTMRDPFAPPLGFGKPERPIIPPQTGNQPIPATAIQGRTVSQDTSKETLPLLMGVVSGGNRQMAIINFNNVSRSYHPGQDIGPYKLVKVDTNSVIVQGPGGRRVLALGR
ncbi:hypothetical protein [Sporomusa malonica]|uniref:Uncharacterized protein n=1 Tax=Sporomusa malonica TaxID=112901 RepID=A0A1W2E9N3_9FIRM|nr:hypothetical protein [Sporomusa malonica]SMD06489.1 hypothetical protein SAMN04488500_12279 [Sporomusa malonica]